MSVVGLLIMVGLTFGVGGYMTYLGWVKPRKIEERQIRVRAQMAEWLHRDAIIEYSTRPLVQIWMWRVGGPMVILMGLVPLVFFIIDYVRMLH
jgi:membrane protein YqaA with SNARE-associated domain